MITKTRIIKLKNKEMDLINSKIQSGAKVTPEELNLLWNSFLIDKRGYKIKMAISYNCPSCNKKMTFPETPNTDLNKWEMLAHSIYTACDNNKRKCCDCERLNTLN